MDDHHEEDIHAEDVHEEEYLNGHGEHNGEEFKEHDLFIHHEEFNKSHERASQGFSRGKNGIARHIFLRLFFLFLLCIATGWFVFSLCFTAVFLVLTLVTLFFFKPYLQKLSFYYSFLKRSLVSMLGCLIALISPSLGIALVLAYFVTDSAHMKSGFHRYVHSHLNKYSNRE